MSDETLYLCIMKGPSPAKARTILASEDPGLLRAIARVIVGHLGQDFALPKAIVQLGEEPELAIAEWLVDSPPGVEH